MGSLSLKKRVIWPVVGAVTAAAIVVGGWAPISQAAPSADGGDAPQTAKAADLGDGTYESCDAYFGLGKAENVMDLVSFDVSDRTGHVERDYVVGTSTEVVFVLTNVDNETLECIPSEITEAEWDAFIDNMIRDLPPGTSLWSFPGPGYYPYPTVPYGPYIEGFGEVTDVGFAVTSVPVGHTLVSPTEITPLVQNYRYPFADDGTSDPRVLDFVEEHFGEAPRAALDTVITDREKCDDDDLPDGFSYAMMALRGWHGFSVDDYPDTCSTAFHLHDLTSFVMSVGAASYYRESIVIDSPEVPTEPTVPETTTPEPTTPEPTKPTDEGSAQVPASQGATPVAAAPAYTG